MAMLARGCLDAGAVDVEAVFPRSHEFHFQYNGKIPIYSEFSGKVR
jgi:hypothetical protein